MYRLNIHDNRMRFVYICAYTFLICNIVYFTTRSVDNNTATKTLHPIREDHIEEEHIQEKKSCKGLVNYDTCSWDIQLTTDTLPVDVRSFVDCAYQQPIPILGINDNDCTYQREGHSSPELEHRMINLTMKAILGLIYDSDWKGYIDGSIWPPATVKASSMIGLRRMQSLQFLLEESIRLNVPGDFIEAGVWRGGAVILATTIFKTYGQTRRVFVADSFKGIPAVDVSKFPADAVHEGSHVMEILNDNSMERVQKTFQNFGVLDDSIIWLPGWFKDSLPAARASFTSFAVARLDGDTYESTWQALENIYDKVSIGGFVIIDDYTVWLGCRKAVDDFRRKYTITSKIYPVYHAIGEMVIGIWWQKNEHISYI